MENRKIKFKLWNATEKKWVESNRFYVDGDGDLFSCGSDEMKLVQYTGLKDKNGKEICEGDIVLNDSVVTWKKDEAMFGISNGKYELGSYSDRYDFEIIGNIYENPNLLK